MDRVGSMAISYHSIRVTELVQHEFMYKLNISDNSLCVFNFWSLQVEVMVHHSFFL